ncbi:MAG: flippase-like domain-containing protein [Nitrospira sp.]|nr:flippase-like domain-containing protein [Nitrospira sp.]
MSEAININRRDLVLWFLRLLFGVILIGLLLTRIDIGDVWSVISRIAWHLLALLIGLYFLGVVVSAAKWKVLIPQYPLRQLLRLNLVGQFYSLVLPGQIAGEAVKAYRLGKGKKDAEAVAASVILDKVTGLLSLLLLGLAGIHISVLQLPSSMSIGLTLVLGGILVLLALLRLPLLSRPLLSFLRALTDRHEKFRRPAIQLQCFVESWIVYLKRPAHLTGSICVGFCYQLVHISIILLLAWKFGVTIAVPDWLWIFAMISVTVLLPITIGGIGVREGAFVGILGKLGVAPETALAISFTIFGLQILGALTGFILEVTVAHQPRNVASPS